MKKILIIREGAIGDVVHTTNVFRSIKETYPNVEIDYVTGPVPAQLLQNDSRLNRVIVLESKKYSYLFKLASQLRKEKYDLIINLQTTKKLTNSMQSKTFSELPKKHLKKLKTQMILNWKFQTIYWKESKQIFLRIKKLLFLTPKQAQPGMEESGQ